MYDWNFEGLLLRLSAFICAGAVHEYAHAWTSYVLGDATAKHEGRLTLNPLPHIDPVGTLLFPLMSVGIGWMRPVPVNPAFLKHPMRDVALISFAGPFSNFCQAALLLLCLRFFETLSVVYFLQYLFSVNVLLMGFNLLPIYPLDGGAILKYFLPYEMRQRYVAFESYGFLILLALVFLPDILGVPDVLMFWLNAFSVMFSVLYGVPLWLLLGVNLLNCAVVVVFFLSARERSSVGSPQKACSSVASSRQDGQVIEFARKLRADRQTPLVLSDEECAQVRSMRLHLNAQARICPPEDYDPDDAVCQHCDYFKNCLIRVVDTQQDQKSQ